MRFARLGVMVVVVLTGCASLPPEPSDPTAPTPLLRMEPLGEPRGTVIALHGFNDRKAAFLPFGARAIESGLRVVAYDQAGFGAQPDRGRWPGTERLVADLHGAIREAQRLAPDAPVFVLGASMGAAVAIAALAVPDAPPVDGLILAAPAAWAGDQLNPFLRASLWLTATLAPGLELSAGGLDLQASDNIPMLRALGRDRFYLPTATAGAMLGLVRLMDTAVARAGKVEPRRIVLIGERDEIVPAAAFDSLVARLAGGDCTVARYADAWHLLLRDLKRQVVFADILAWIAGEPLPSGRARPCSAPKADGSPVG